HGILPPNSVDNSIFVIVPDVHWYSPRIVPLGTTTFSANGSGFVPGSIVKLDGSVMPSTYISSTQLSVSSNFSQSGSGMITVTNPGTPDVTSQPSLLEWGQGIVVKIDPPSATVSAGAQKQFTANVTGTTNTQVWWYVNGGSSNGTITSGGMYKAPKTPPS